MNGCGNFDFDLDLKRAKKSEKEVAAIIRQTFGGDITIRSNNTKHYDLLFIRNGQPHTVEVKEDLSCKKTGNVCVEYFCRGERSGIDATTAEFFVYKVHESPTRIRFYMCRTDKLREAIADKKYFRTFEWGGDPNSDTRGYLFTLEAFKRIMDDIT